MTTFQIRKLDWHGYMILTMKLIFQRSEDNCRKCQTQYPGSISVIVIVGNITVI